MDTQKGIITRFGEWWDEQRIHRHQVATARSSSRFAAWLPSRGNVVFTLAVAGLLILAQSVGALPLGRPVAAPSGSSTGTIAYQGRLADSAGAPLTGTYNMIFRLYSAAGGGVPLWEEPWIGTSEVSVSDGLFNVMLGSLTPIPQSTITGNDPLFLGITVGSDDEMTPRVQLGSVPYATQALTVPDSAIATTKLADAAVTNAKIADGAITAEKLAPGLSLVPSGTVVMWSGSLATIPSGWALCDGANGTPDLRDRFVVGAGSTYSVGNTGGQSSVILTVDQMPVHSHTGTTSNSGNLVQFSRSENHGNSNLYGMGTQNVDNNWWQGAHTHTFTTSAAGGGQAHENRPPYYALAFIMKLP